MSLDSTWLCLGAKPDLLQDKLRSSSSDVALQIPQKTNKHWGSGYMVSVQGQLTAFYWHRCADLGKVNSVLFWKIWACIEAPWRVMKPAKSKELQGFFWGHHTLKSALKNLSTMDSMSSKNGPPQTHSAFLMDLSFAPRSPPGFTFTSSALILSMKE